MDARSIGSLLDATIGLIADGHTTLAFNDDFDDFDSRISYRIHESGRYYAAIRSFGDFGTCVSTTSFTATVICNPAGTEQAEWDRRECDATRHRQHGHGRAVRQR